MDVLKAMGLATIITIIGLPVGIKFGFDYRVVTAGLFIGTGLLYVAIPDIIEVWTAEL